MQDFFGVGKDCKCNKEKIYIQWPEFKRINLPSGYAEAWEPQYEDPSYKVPKLAQHACYRGDDFGGHNIPFPHPVPPKPDTRIYDDAFVDLGRIFGVYANDDKAFYGRDIYGFDDGYSRYGSEPYGAVSYGPYTYEDDYLYEDPDADRYYGNARYERVEEVQQDKDDVVLRDSLAGRIYGGYAPYKTYEAEQVETRDAPYYRTVDYTVPAREEDSYYSNDDYGYGYGRQQSLVSGVFSDDFDALSFGSARGW